MAVSIANTLPELQAAEKKLHAAALARGIDYVIADFGGLRSQADTARIIGYRQQDYAAAVRANPDTAKTPIQQWRPISPFGSSMHNYGAAFDVLITKHPAGVNGYAALGAIAPSCGLRWGGDAGFVAADRVDPPHFQLPISLVAARVKWLGVPGAVVGTVRANPLVTAAVVAITLILGIAAVAGGRPVRF